MKIQALRNLRQSYQDCLAIAQLDERDSGRSILKGRMLPEVSDRVVAARETQAQLNFAISKLTAEICYRNPSSDALSVRFNRALKLIGYQFGLVIGTLVGMLFMGAAMLVAFVLGAIALVFGLKVEKIK